MWLGLGASILLCACGRFPRNNPNDPGASGKLSIEHGETDIVIADLNSPNAPANNENAKVEPGESVLVSVPIDIRWSKQAITTTAAVTDLNDGDDCPVSALPQGAQGNQFMLVLPATRNVPVSGSVGPTLVTIGANCEPGTTLSFELNIGPIGDTTFDVPFEIEVREREGEVDLSYVVVDDSMPGGNADGILDLGETVLLIPTLLNTGRTLVPGVKLQVPAEGRKCVERVFAPSRSLMFGNMLPDQEVTSVDTLQVTVSTGCENGDALTLDFDAVDASGKVWPLSWSQAIGPDDAGADPDSDAGL